MPDGLTKSVYGLAVPLLSLFTLPISRVRLL